MPNLEVKPKIRYKEDILTTRDNINKLIAKRRMRGHESEVKKLANH